MKRTLLLLAIFMTLAGCTKVVEIHKESQLLPVHVNDSRVKTFDINLSNYKIEPNVIRVNLGDRIRLYVYNREGDHGFSIPWFNINVGRIPEGEMRVVEFVASKKLTTEMRCSFYCGKEHAGMVGYLVVE